MTRKQIERLAGTVVVLVTVYGDQFHATIGRPSGRWSFEAEYNGHVGLFARSDITEFHPL